MVERLCYIKSKIRPEDSRALSTWRYQYGPEVLLLNKVWIHDYFLALLPEMIKKEIPTAYIGFFMHAPFPSSEFFRCLPSRSLSHYANV